MQYSTFNKELLHDLILYNTQKLSDSKSYRHLHLTIYVKLPDSSVIINKIIHFRIAYNDGKYRAFITNDFATSLENSDEFIETVVENIMKLKPCKLCTRLTIKKADICHQCKYIQVSDLSGFQQKCSICQTSVKSNGRIMNCCGNFLHMLCYKEFKYKKINHITSIGFCEDCDKPNISCPYCRECIYC